MREPVKEIRLKERRVVVISVTFLAASSGAALVQLLLQSLLAFMAL